MRNLPLDRKRYLLRQNREMRFSSSDKANVPKLSQSATLGPTKAASLIPALIPNLTGDNGVMKRFSVSSWGSPLTSQTTGSSVEAPGSPVVANNFKSPRNSIIMKDGDSPIGVDIAPLQPQTTGGLWGGWWSSSGGDSWVGSLSKSMTSPKQSKTTSFYADGLRSRRLTDIKLVKHLISLRVHLSTAKLSWVEQFLGESKGMDALAFLLANLVAKGGKHKKLSDTEESVLYEVVKCLRVLLNTEVSDL